MIANAVAAREIVEGIIQLDCELFIIYPNGEDQRRKSLWPLVQRRERLHGDIQVLDIVVTQHQASGGPRKVHRAQRSFLQRVAL